MLIKSIQILGVLGVCIFASLDSDNIANIIIIGLGLICSLGVIGLTLRWERTTNNTNENETNQSK
jgi:amino acid permease